MGVYLYQSGTEKELKNAYIGEYVPPIDTPGIYHNATLGLISISGDGSTRYTIQDKNLGATTVYNQGDTLTDANCGYYYQWGNCYGFPHSGSVTTSSTVVDTTGYGPGNYYSSSTFVAIFSSTGDWSWQRNDNLWGASTGTVEAMQGPSPSGFHIPTSNEWSILCGILVSTFSLARNSTTMGTYLKMPMCSCRNYDSGAVATDSSGRYWSSSPNFSYASFLYFYSSNINWGEYSERANGHSLRAFKNEAVQPDSSRTKLY